MGRKCVLIIKKTKRDDLSNHVGFFSFSFSLVIQIGVQGYTYYLTMFDLGEKLGVKSVSYSFIILE